MKNVLYRVFMTLPLVFTAFIASAQWQTLNSGTTETLLDIHFLTPEYGAVVGKNGTVLLTEDGGNLWTGISNLTEDLGSVRVLGVDTILVAGANVFAANVYLTVDGGTNWNNVSPGARLALVGENIFALGYDKIRVSTDQGAIWQNGGLDLGGTLIMEQISFADEQIGFIAGNISGFANYSTYGFHTNDGGGTWEDWYVFDFPTADAWTVAAFADPDTVYLFTNQYEFFQPSDTNRLLRMTDFHLEDGYGWRFSAEVVNDFMPGYIYDAHFFNPDYGYSVSAEGSIFRTGDGGNHWTENFSGPDSLRSIFTWNEDLIFVAGSHGRILRLGQVNSTQSPKVSSLLLYPNPVASSFFLQGIPEDDGLLYIYNNLGQLLKTLNWQVGQEISAATLPAGHYLVELRGREKRYIGKMTLVK